MDDNIGLNDPLTSNSNKKKNTKTSEVNKHAGVGTLAFLERAEEETKQREF